MEKENWADCWVELLVFAEAPEDYRAFVHPIDYVHFRKLNRTVLEIETDVKSFSKGWQGTLLLSGRRRPIGTSSLVPPGKVIFAPMNTDGGKLLVTSGSAVSLPVCRVSGHDADGKKVIRLTDQSYAKYVPVVQYKFAGYLTVTQPLATNT